MKREAVNIESDVPKRSKHQLALMCRGELHQLTTRREDASSCCKSVGNHFSNRRAEPPENCPATIRPLLVHILCHPLDGLRSRELDAIPSQVPDPAGDLVQRR